MALNCSAKEIPTSKEAARKSNPTHKSKQTFRSRPFFRPFFLTRPLSYFDILDDSWWFLMILSWFSPDSWWLSRTDWFSLSLPPSLSLSFSVLLSFTTVDLEVRCRWVDSSALRLDSHQKLLETLYDGFRFPKNFRLKKTILWDSSQLCRRFVRILSCDSEHFWLRSLMSTSLVDSLKFLICFFFFNVPRGMKKENRRKALLDSPRFLEILENGKNSQVTW